MSPRGVGVVATLICWGAGAYLLLGHTVLANSSITWVAHGIGLYFIAKGFFIAAVTHLQTDIRDDLAAIRDSLATSESPPSDSPPPLNTDDYSGVRR